MYSYEEKMRVLKLYIQYNHRVAPVVRDLGYPDCHMLVKWYQQYEAMRMLIKEVKRRPKFSEQQKQEALQYYWKQGQGVV